jgi:simple sugar transport system permease protein
MGVRVTVNLTTVERATDDIFPASVQQLRFGGEYWGEIPIVTLLLGVLLLVGIILFFRTKLGQDLRATGQDPDIAEVAGVNVRRCRIIAVILSMVLAGIGQILYLQNMGTMNTFTQHEQVGFYAIAALLVGGATVVRATVWNAVLGTFLFHTMITVVAVAGRKIAVKYDIPEPAQVGEYLREFVAFAVIGTALALHAWRTRGRSL